MTQYHLTVAVLSGDNALAQLIQGVQFPEEFAAQVVGRSAPDPELLKKCQILVWDLPGKTPQEVRAMCGEDVKIVFCGSREVLDAMTLEGARAVNLLVQTPVRPAVMTHHLEQLLLRVKMERELRLASTCIHTMIDSVPDMIWIKSVEGAHVLVNRSFCSVVGKSREDVTGKDHYYIWDVSPDDPDSGADACVESENAVIAAGHTLQSSEQVKSSGGMRQLTIYKSPLYDLDGTPLATVGIGRDITNLENMSTEIDILLQGMPYAVLLRDGQGRIFDANRRFEEDFGMTKDQIVGQHYDQWAQVAFHPERTQNSDGFPEAVTLSGKCMELRKENIYDIFGKVVGQVCMFRDVTVERQMEAQIIENANTDFMTGLNNRRSLYVHLRDHCQGQKISLFYLDLDHFKSINDLYGHNVGDEALILTAQILKEQCAKDFVARMGGDEFLIVKMGEDSMEDLEKEAQALLQRLLDAYHARPNLSALSASIGIAHSEDANDFERLIRQSDAALYRAKEDGRARCRAYEQEG